MLYYVSLFYELRNYDYISFFEILFTSHHCLLILIEPMNRCLKHDREGTIILALLRTFSSVLCCYAIAEVI